MGNLVNAAAAAAAMDDETNINGDEKVWLYSFVWASILVLLRYQDKVEEFGGKCGLSIESSSIGSSSGAS